MADVDLRDLEGLMSGARRDEPMIPPRSVTPPTLREPRLDPVMAAPSPSPQPKTPSWFTEPRLGGPDALEIDGTLGRLAELVAHGRTATPSTVALLGGPGSGKTFALDRTLATIRDLAAAAAKSAGSPFLERVHVQTIDAATLDGEITGALAAILHAGLRPTYPDLARELAFTARDPHTVLREINDKLDEARRRLDSERRSLDDAGSRRAQLAETVLFGGAGSQIDAYARANAGRIESRFAAFGVTGDPIRSYKEFVQHVAGSGGRLALVLRSFWAFKGQGKLLAATIGFVALRIGFGIAVADQDWWLAQLRAGPQAGTAVANWLAEHMDWFASAESGALVLAALAAIANLWRASAFDTPIFKGARLLAGDLDGRRRDLDSHVAHGTKRVDTLQADVDRLTREAVEAERRTGGADPLLRHMPAPFATSGPVQMQTLFAALSRAITTGNAIAPQRIVLALDHFDAVAPERARAILDALHRMLGPGLVALVTADPARLDQDKSRRGELARWIDVLVRLDADAPHRDPSALVARALGRSEPVRAVRSDGRRSSLDHPIDEKEASLLTILAPLAGTSPRAVKRFVATYGLSRLESGIHPGALALMLAVALGGSEAERATMDDALAAAQDAGTDAFTLPQQAPGRLRSALDTAMAIAGRFSARDALAAARCAARFSLAP